MTDKIIQIPYQSIFLDGILNQPKNAKGLILFAHGSGSGRLSPRNQFVARVLQEAQFATLLFDLLTPDEDKLDAQTAQFRFDINLLAERLIAVTNWIVNDAAFNRLSIGYFGASTGGAAALVAAATQSARIKAVVSRGGRPDLAGKWLSNVRAATLLIIGGLDEVVIELNKQAYEKLTCEKELIIIPGATHLFEEPGKLEAVARVALKWFAKYL